MKKTFTLLALCMVGHTFLNAQCNFLPEAVATGDTLRGLSGDVYKTALAYHPGFQYYYSNNAGGGTASEVFDLNGNVVFTSYPTDWRGLWYNPNTGNIEGNSWSNNIIVDSLQANGDFMGNTAIIGSILPPEPQASAVYDSVLNRLYYYYSGKIYSFDRTNLAAIDTVDLNGLPEIPQLTNVTLIYTGCTGAEIGIFHNANKEIHLFNRLNGAWSNTISFPANATTPTLYNTHFAYTNGLVWTYSDFPQKMWVAYNIYDHTAEIEDNISKSIKFYPNPAEHLLNIELITAEKIFVMDFSGKIVMESENSMLHQLDVSNLANGLYVVKTGSGITDKFVKK
ncbi:MAG: T9SS type A sorting domain-containing protein [Brumimicrobium sp.]|nr:T9SS type A sorting domain-containing protein [Brumimicrobium sp.]